MEFTKENYLKMNMELYSFNGFLGVKLIKNHKILYKILLLKYLLKG